MNIIDLPGAVHEGAPEPQPAKVIPIGAVTLLDLEPDVMLESLKGSFEGLVYAGFGKNGEIICGSSYADGGTAMWLIEGFRKQLLKEV